MTNRVVLGADYFAQGAVGQNVTLVHEALHAALNKDDIQLAATLGLGQFDPVTLGISSSEAASLASKAVSAFLSPTGFSTGGLAGSNCTK